MLFQTQREKVKKISTLSVNVSEQNFYIHEAITTIPLKPRKHVQGVFKEFFENCKFQDHFKRP